MGTYRAVSRRRDGRRDGKQSRERGAQGRTLAFFALGGTIALVAAVLLLRQGPAQTPAPPAAPAPVEQTTQLIDWKVKGAPGAPVLVEEWGDFQ